MGRSPGESGPRRPGAAVDPGSSVNFRGWAGFSGPMIHFLLASMTLGANVIVNYLEYQTISRNNRLINQVMNEVRQMRIERGLPVSQSAKHPPKPTGRAPWDSR